MPFGMLRLRFSVRGAKFSAVSFVIALDLQSLHGPLISRPHIRQRKMLVHLQALLASVSGDQLNLGVRQALSRKPREHLVPEQMRMDPVRQYSVTICSIRRVEYFVRCRDSNR